MPDAPIVYWRPGCPYCVALRAKLWASRLTYQAVNIETDRSAASTVRRVNNGDELVPTVQIGDRFLSNPSLRAVKEALAGRS